MLRPILYLASVILLAAQPKPLNWSQIDKETLQHFSALVQINSTDPGGSEKPVVDYLKAVLDKEGIESKIFTRTNLADPSRVRPNIVARLKGNGKKKPRVTHNGKYSARSVEQDRQRAEEGLNGRRKCC